MRITGIRDAVGAHKNRSRVTSKNSMIRGKALSAVLLVVLTLALLAPSVQAQSCDSGDTPFWYSTSKDSEWPFFSGDGWSSSHVNGVFEENACDGYTLSSETAFIQSEFPEKGWAHKFWTDLGAWTDGEHANTEPMGEYSSTLKLVQVFLPDDQVCGCDTGDRLVWAERESETAGWSCEWGWYSGAPRDRVVECTTELSRSFSAPFAISGTLSAATGLTVDDTDAIRQRSDCSWVVSFYGHNHRGSSSGQNPITIIGGDPQDLLTSGTGSAGGLTDAGPEEDDNVHSMTIDPS